MKSLDAIRFKRVHVQLALFASLTFIIFINPLFNEAWYTYLYRVGFSILFIVSMFTINQKRKRTVKYGVILMIAFWITLVFDLTYLNVITDVIISSFFVIMVIRFFRQIVQSKVVNAAVILESISGYLMLGLLLSYITIIVLLIFPGSLVFPGGEEPNHTNIIYFIFVTMSTLGYGDVLPIIPLTRSLSIFTSISGQMYLAIIIAMLVGKYSAQRSAS